MYKYRIVRVGSSQYYAQVKFLWWWRSISWRDSGWGDPCVVYHEQDAKELIKNHAWKHSEEYKRAVKESEKRVVVKEYNSAKDLDETSTD